MLDGADEPYIRKTPPVTSTIRPTSSISIHSAPTTTPRNNFTVIMVSTFVPIAALLISVVAVILKALDLCCFKKVSLFSIYITTV